MANFRDGLPLIPPHMHEGISNYLIHGIPPGGFLTALIICDRWTEILARADHTNAHALPAWAQFFYSHMPRASWGSAEIMKAWLEDKDEIRTFYLSYLNRSEPRGPNARPI